MNTVQIAVGGFAALILLVGAYEVGQSHGEAPGAAVVGAADPALVNTAAGKTQTQTQTKAAPAQASHTQASTSSAAAEPKMCNECATVVDVHSERREGKTSGLGAVGGALLGGVLGHQVGGGTGKKLATVAGVAAGGYAGNSVEKSQTAHQVWLVRVSYPDGGTRSFEFDHQPDFRANTVVRVHNGELERF